MSIQEKLFLKWLVGIASTVIIAMLINTFAVMGSVDVMAEKIETNSVKIQETRNYHEKDLRIIYDNMGEIKADQKIMMSDIKKLLQK
jgi:uncharacterized protein (UPF0332 family)